MTNELIVFKINKRLNLKLRECNQEGMAPVGTIATLKSVLEKFAISLLDENPELCSSRTNH